VCDLILPVPAHVRMLIVRKKDNYSTMKIIVFAFSDVSAWLIIFRAVSELLIIFRAVNE
jgi:hypothetical protein